MAFSLFILNQLPNKFTRFSQMMKLNTLLVLIFAGTYFSGDRNDCISRVYIVTDSP